MDVMTIRSSQKGGLSTSQNATASRVNNKDHTKLLVEPIVLPDMNHLQVDDAREVNQTCLFYPTGHKNNSMRRSMEDTVRKVHAVDKPFYPKRSSTILTAPKKKKVLDPTMPTEPLVYTRAVPETDKGVAFLMGRKKINEQNLRMAIRPEY